MHAYLIHLEHWRQSKARALNNEGFIVIVTNELGDSKKARYIELENEKVIGRATIWDSGELVLEAIAVDSENQIVLISTEVTEIYQLDEKLNWWLREMVCNV